MILYIVFFGVRVLASSIAAKIRAGATTTEAKATSFDTRVALSWLDNLYNLTMTSRALGLQSRRLLVTIPLVRAGMTIHHLSAGVGIQVASGRSHSE